MSLAVERVQARAMRRGYALLIGLGVPLLVALSAYAVPRGDLWIAPIVGAAYAYFGQRAVASYAQRAGDRYVFNRLAASSVRERRKADESR